MLQIRLKLGELGFADLSEVSFDLTTEIGDWLATIERSNDSIRFPGIVFDLIVIVDSERDAQKLIVIELIQGSVLGNNKRKAEKGKQWGSDWRRIEDGFKLEWRIKMEGVGDYRGRAMIEMEMWIFLGWRWTMGVWFLVWGKKRIWDFNYSTLSSINYFPYLGNLRLIEWVPHKFCSIGSIKFVSWNLELKLLSFALCYLLHFGIGPFSLTNHNWATNLNKFLLFMHILTIC